MKQIVNGIALNAVEQGHGDPALVFLHYWGGSSRTWNEVMSLLAGDHRCVALDQRGWGESEAPSLPEEYAIRYLADDAQALIENLHLKDYILVGHSMGGKAAQLLASRRPDGLRGLILVAPAPPSPRNVPHEFRSMMEHFYETRDGVEEAIGNLSSLALSQAQRTMIIEDSMRGNAAARVGWPRIAMLDDITSEVKNIDVPVLVIAGENDGVEPIALLQDEVITRIPGASLEVLPRVGHLAMLEDPAALSGRIRKFVML